MKGATTFLLLLLGQIVLNIGIDISEVVQQVNRDHKTEINIFINLNSKEEFKELNADFVEAVSKLSHLPKLITTNGTNINRLQGSFSEYSLTLAWLTWENVNSTFVALDKLLKGLHFTDIILVYLYPLQLDHELLYISELCWRYGFTSAMIWTDQRLFTYHPYPTVGVRTLHNVSQFGDKSHLQNFQMYAVNQVTVDFPPRFYNYTDRRGQVVYAGYMHKLIHLFLNHHNASIVYLFYDMWSKNVSLEAGLARCEPKGCAIIPILASYDELFLASSSPFLAKVMLMVPSSQEIPESSYVVIPFDSLVWTIVLLNGLLYFVLLRIINSQRKPGNDLGLDFLAAFRIVMFLSGFDTKGRSFRHFALSLLFLFTGLFLTNYYSTSLWSLYTSKVYEPELEYLTDIGRTNLKIFLFSPDMKYYTELYLPPLIVQRFYVGDETKLAIYRQNLNTTYIYAANEDLADYLLLQQSYLKRPFAKKLPQPFYYRPFFISLQLRSPFFQQFNGYLSSIFESGIFNKFVNDAQWEGMMSSGTFRLFRDSDDTNEALSLDYFYYAFVILFLGLTAALFGFVIEIICSHRRRKTRTILQ